MQTLLKKLLKLGVVFLFIRNFLVALYYVFKKAFKLLRNLFSKLSQLPKFAILRKYAGIIKHFVAVQKSRYNKLSLFQQKLTSSLFIGLCCYFLFSFFQNTILIKDLTDRAFDNTLVFYTDYAKKNNKQPAPIYIGIDEESFQSVQWRNNKATALDLDNILQLADTAFIKGSNHVFIDMQGYAATQIPEFERFIEKYQDSKQTKHLYMVVPFKPDPCLPSVPFRRQLHPSILDKLVSSREFSSNRHSSDVSLIFGSLYIHPVTPSYYESADKVIRFWQLFGVYETQNLGVKSWAFLPSPQLAYHVVSQIEGKNTQPKDVLVSRNLLNQLPWLHVFYHSTDKLTRSINHTEYSEKVFKSLINLSKSDLLPRYCINDKKCLQQRFSSSNHSTSENAFKLSNNLSSKIAHKGSHQCIQDIDAFSQKYQANAVRSDIMQNRIVYSMRSWREESNANNQNYEMFTPLQLVDENQKSRLAASWQDRFVVIGAEFLQSGDANYLTPIANMSGAMINLNAMVSFNNFGAIGLISTWKKHLLNLLVIVLVSLLIARFNAKVAVLVSTSAFVLITLFLYKWMFHNGLWVEFGLPIFVINIMQLIIEFLEKKRQE